MEKVGINMLKKTKRVSTYVFYMYALQKSILCLNYMLLKWWRGALVISLLCPQGIRGLGDLSQKSHTRYQVNHQKVCRYQVWVSFILSQSKRNGWRGGFLRCNRRTFVSCWIWKYRISVRFNIYTLTVIVTPSTVIGCSAKTNFCQMAPKWTENH